MDDSLIIRSKYLIPDPPPFAICRKRVESMISEGFKKNFLFVVGSSGSGKTTAISLYLSKHKLKNVIYIRLTEEDANFSIFARYIVAGLRKIGMKSVNFENIMGANSRAYILSAYVINKVEDFKEDVYLILDDFHNVENSETLNFINPIFNNRIPNFHVAILSQKKPSMKIGKEVMKGNAVLISEKDLYFTEKEFLTLAEKVGMRISRTNAERIFKRTEGWPIGVVASIKLYSKGIKEFEKSYEEMFREILEAQDKKTRNLLVKISPLSEVSPSILKGYLTDEEIDILMKLPDRGAFCYRTKHGFRLQNLFRDFLLTEFEKLPDKEKYLRRLGKHFEGHDAVHSLVFYLKARDFESAANLIRTTNFLPLGIIGFETARNLLNEVPPGYLVKLPEVALLKGEVSLRVGDVKVADSIADRILKTETTLPVRFKAYVLKISSLVFQGNYATAVKFVKEAEEIAKDFDFSKTVDFYYLAARIYYLTGQFENARKTVDILISNLNSVKNPLNRAKILNSYCIVNLSREGKFKEVEDFYGDIISMLHSYNLNADPRYYVNLAIAQMNMGRLEDAENTLEEAFEIAHKLSWKERFPDIETESGFLSLMKNDLDKAERFFERVEKRRNINKFLQGACNMGRSVLMRKKRNFEKALEYAEEDLKITESMGQGAMVGESLLNIAKIYLARGDFETALEYMEKAEPLLVKGHDNFVLDNLKLLRCIAKGGDVKQIIDKIEKKEYFGILLSDSDILYQYLNETKSALQKVVSIKTLGKFEVFVKNERVPYKKFRRKGVITFFKYLVSNFPKQISIDKISDDLYRHLDLKKAKHNIYVSVSVINKLFESYGVKEMIIRAQGMYGLNPGVIKSIDFIEFTELARKSKFKEMVNIYQGAFLEENMYDDWTMQIRDYISGLYVNALSNLAEKEKGAKKEVLLRKLLDADPLNEEAAKSLLAYYIDNGNKSAAISFYEKIKKVYEEDYGMDLPGGIVSLFERI